LRAHQPLLKPGHLQRNGHGRSGGLRRRRDVRRQQWRVALVVSRIKSDVQRCRVFLGLSDLAGYGGLPTNGLNQIAQVVVIHPDRPVGGIKEPARGIRSSPLDYQYVTTVLVGNRSFATHRLQNDHACFPERRRAVSCSATCPNDTPHPVLSGGRIAVGQPRATIGIAVLAGGKVVGPSTHGKGTR
jgi:hypothetical protein